MTEVDCIADSYDAEAPVKNKREPFSGLPPYSGVNDEGSVAGSRGVRDGYKGGSTGNGRLYRADGSRAGTGAGSSDASG